MEYINCNKHWNQHCHCGRAVSVAIRSLYIIYSNFSGSSSAIIEVYEERTLSNQLSAPVFQRPFPGVPPKASHNGQTLGLSSIFIKIPSFLHYSLMVVFFVCPSVMFHPICFKATSLRSQAHPTGKWAQNPRPSTGRPSTYSPVQVIHMHSCFIFWRMNETKEQNSNTNKNKIALIIVKTWRLWN